MIHHSFRPRLTDAAGLSRRAFTLLELLVVMGILLVLATLTTISVGNVTRDAKLASATNTIVAALGNARAVAIRDNAYIMVTFRVAPDRRARSLPREPQVVQVVTARWTGEVLSRATLGNNPPAVVAQFPNDVFAERFLPVPGVPTRELPAGVLVAGPAFGFVSSSQQIGANDEQWRTQPRFAGTPNLTTNPPTYAVNAAATELGWAIGVLFGPDGRTLSRSPDQVVEVVTDEGQDQNAYVKGWVDIDGDGYPRKGSTPVPPYGPQANVQWFVYKEPTDEPMVDYVPFLAVFNDKEARERFEETAPTWKGLAIGFPGVPPPRVRDHSLFIEERADRISFNRFTGVPGIVPK